MNRFAALIRVAAATTALALLAGSAFVAPTAAAGEPSGYRLQQGSDLDGFTVPADIRLVWSWPDSLTGLTFERYQQYAAPLNVLVEGAQLTVVRRGQKAVLVVGNHYPGLRVTQQPALRPLQAISIAAAHADAIPEAVIPPGGELRHTTQLRVDPDSGALFYLVQSTGAGTRLFQQINANSGLVIDAWSGIDGANPGTGVGVKGDQKSLTGDTLTGSGALTSLVGSNWRMSSADGRIVTYDAKGSSSYGLGSGIPVLSDSKAAWQNDNDWSAQYQAVGVDAQYYAALTLSFYTDRFGYDPLAPANNCNFSSIENVVHYNPYPWSSVGYDNAFWDGAYMVYGDGDGLSTRGMSGGQDVVTHELTHAVTECRAELTYKNESGALNESFSDMMAIAAERDFEEPLSSNCRLNATQSECADWWLGEDVVVGSGDFAFRNLQNPALEGQPTHLSGERYIGRSYDNGGVHFNSGIPNHAFYLMVQGGRNARCVGPTDTHADCDVVVPQAGMTHAEQIMFRAWAMLTTNAKFCDARSATIAAADLLIAQDPGTYSQADHAAAELAWRAVGVGPCSTPPGFDIQPTTHSVAAKPGGSAELAINVIRSTDNDPIDFDISDPSPATASFSPDPSVNAPTDTTTLTFDVRGDAAPGVYPVTISASSGLAVHKVSVALLIDADAPTAQVTGIHFSTTGSVLADGHVPLSVTWSSSDATSGVATGGIDADGSHLGSGPSGAATFSSVDGQHQFQASATDAAGNSASSGPTNVTQTSFQEFAPTYSGWWSTYNSATPWGATRYSKKKGASATFTFSGTDVAWVASRGPKRGKAKVYLDGVLTKVDLYAASSSTGRMVFTATGLVAGPHTLRIVVNGTPGRPRVDVDGFVVLAP